MQFSVKGKLSYSERSMNSSKVSKKSIPQDEEPLSYLMTKSLFFLYQGDLDEYNGRRFSRMMSLMGLYQQECHKMLSAGESPVISNDEYF